MGANVSTTRTKLETEIKANNTTANELDLSQTCNMSADASQIIDGLKISGSKDVTLKQVNSVQNLCMATAVANLKEFNDLSADTQNELMKSLEQEGGLGVNVSDTTTEVLNRMELETNTKTKMDLAKKCLINLKATQGMKNITIEDAQNINLLQESESFNKCILDSAVDIAKENGFDFKVKTKVAEDTAQKGWDPIASAASFIGNLGMLIIAPAIACAIILLVVSIGSSVMSSQQSSGGGPLSELPKVGQQLGINSNTIGNITKQFDTKNIPALVKQFIPQSGGGSILSYLSRIISPRISQILLVTIIAGIIYWIVKHRTTPTSIENFHKSQHRVPRLDTPMVNRHQFHAPHISQDVYHGRGDSYPYKELPDYIKRW